MCKIECGYWYICQTNHGHPNIDWIDWEALHSDLPPEVDPVYWETECRCSRRFKWDISEIISVQGIVCNPTFLKIHCTDCYKKVSEDSKDEEYDRMKALDEEIRDEWSEEVLKWMKANLPDFWNSVPQEYDFWWEETPVVSEVRQIEDTEDEGMAERDAEENTQVQPNYRARLSSELERQKRLSTIDEEDEEAE